MGKREAVTEYRTIDGGHPAPFPDMTDEQLYNYEMAFTVPRKTFDQPPASTSASTERTAAPPPPRKPAPDIPAATPRYTAAPQAAPAPPPPTPDSARPLDFDRPIRTTTTKQPVDIITTRARHPVYQVHGYIGD